MTLQMDLRYHSNDAFGASIANMGDLDGDGYDDLAVGATHDDAGGSNRGAVHILFMDEDGAVKSAVEINSSTYKRSYTN